MKPFCKLAMIYLAEDLVSVNRKKTVIEIMNKQSNTIVFSE